MNPALQRKLYVEAMGRQPPPPKPDTDPLAWQWKYKGSKVDRERLAALVGVRRP